MNNDLTPLVQQPGEVNSFFFQVNASTVDITHTVAAGLIAMIGHAREVSDGVLADVFCFDAANYHIGNALCDYYGSINNFEEEYNEACSILREIVLNQATILEMYIMSMPRVGNIFYHATAQTLLLFIQEDDTLLTSGTYAGVLEEINYEDNLMLNIKLHADHFPYPPLPEGECPF